MTSNATLRSGAGTWAWIAVAAIFLAYAILLFRNTSLAAGGPDESGYMNAARMFAAGELRREVEPLRRLSLDGTWLRAFTPLGFKSVGDRWIVPAYPPGLPLHLIAAGFYVSPLLALGSVVLTFALGRQLDLSVGYSLAAAAILALTPQFIMFALQVMSDVPATFWALLAVWLALRSESGVGTAILAGTAFAIGVSVRPTNVLVGVPLLIAVRMRPKPLAGMAVGALPVMLGLLWFQREAYGGALTTGYGSVTDVITFERFGEKLFFYSFWMGATLSPIIAPAGLLVVFNRRVSGWKRALLPAWYLVFIGFYCLWALFDEWWYTRFLLPATPAIIIAALIVIRDMVPTRTFRVVLMVIAIAVPWMQASERRVLRIDDDQRVYTGAMEWSAALIPRDAMVVSGVLSGAFLLYQERFTARWDELDRDRFEMIRNRARWYAVLSDVEVDIAEFQRRLPGRWTPISRFRNVTLYRLDGRT